MKVLVLTELVEKNLVNILDIAYKNEKQGGIAIHAIIDSIMKAAQEIEMPGEKKQEESSLSNVELVENL